MKNLDAIINQLSNEQLRTEHMLLEDLESVKKACVLFFDKQSREADAFIALLNTTLDDVKSRVKNGYPKNERNDVPLPVAPSEDPVPAFLLKPKTGKNPKEEVLAGIEEALSKNS